ncbi:MAG: hypothetical protein DMG27_10330 [Acidobacteria bacterium]|nr:MAG: hypothetical protein DMG27_10330 [Acidobacteriota bacterium]
MDPGTQSVGVSDNATGSGSANFYSKDADVTNGTGTTGVRTLVFSAPVTRALSNNTITICSGGTGPSCSGGTAANMAATFFYSNGIVSPSPKDLCHTATGSGITKNTTVLSSGTTATSCTSSTPATTSQADELLVGALGLDDHGGNLAPGNSFTNLATSQNGGGASHTFQVQPSYLVVKATGQYAATWTYNQDSSRRWAAAIVTYKIVFPTISSIAMDPADITTSPSTTNKNSVNFNVTFSEAVFGVDDQDFALDSTNTTVSGASITSVTPNDNIHYTVAVNTGTGNGTIQLNYHEGDTDYHMDINNIPLGGSDYVANGVGTYSFTGPTYTVSKSVATSTTVSSSNISPTYGDSVTFTAKVHAVSGSTAPSGSVTFTIDGTAGAPVILGACSPTSTTDACASTSTSSLTVGGSAHNVAADYTHTGSFTDSSGSLSGGQTVGQATQTITFNAFSGKTYGDGPFGLSATGGDSGNAVTFSSTTTGVCTASGTNGSTVTIVAAGSCSIKASQAGNANYSAAPDVTRSFSVAAKNLTASIINNPTKIYDGNSSATLTSANFSLSGLVGSDNFTVTKAAGTYNSKDVATATTVTASLALGDFTALGSTVATNYTLPTTASGAGTITTAPLTATLTAADKTYDGTTTEPNASMSCSLLRGQQRRVQHLAGCDGEPGDGDGNDERGLGGQLHAGRGGDDDEFNQRHRHRAHHDGAVDGHPDGQ